MSILRPFGFVAFAVLAACDAADEPVVAADAAPDAGPVGDAGPLPDAGLPPDAAAPVQCPLVLAENQCGADADCSPDEVCYAPEDGPAASGACADDELDECTADADCAGRGPAFICEFPDLVCGVPQGRRCLQGCVDTCAPGASCGADHRCAPSACDAATPCPTDFACGEDGRCARRACDAHADCATCCVNGRCFGAPGTCSYLPQ